MAGALSSLRCCCERAGGSDAAPHAQSTRPIARIATITTMPPMAKPPASRATQTRSSRQSLSFIADIVGRDHASCRRVHAQFTRRLGFASQKCALLYAVLTRATDPTRHEDVE